MRAVVRVFRNLIDAVAVGETDRDLRLGRRQSVNTNQVIDRDGLLQVWIAEEHSKIIELQDGLIEKQFK